MDDQEKNIGLHYIKQTRFDRTTIQQMQQPETVDVQPFKHYTGVDTISLPRKWDLSEARITPLLQNRRSLRAYSSEKITLGELAFMLWGSQGITAQAGKYLFRTSPSGGALYPIETYLSVHRVEDVEPGLYHFDPELFQLERLTDHSIGDQLVTGCLNQKFVAASSITFVWSAVFHRNLNKYGNRGMRYILLDAGHICQNVLMAAEAVGCGGCPVAAFFDGELNTLLDLDGEQESVLYLASVGKK